MSLLSKLLFLLLFVRANSTFPPAPPITVLVHRHGTLGCQAGGKERVTSLAPPPTVSTVILTSLAGKLRGKSSANSARFWSV